MSTRWPAVAVNALGFLVAACSGPTALPGGTQHAALATPVGWETAAVATLGATPVPVPVVVGLPYKPDVQFTPLYVAIARGYFRAEGLDVELRYGDESSFVRLVAAHEMTAVVSSGEQVILARANAIPVTYVCTWYGRFPVVVFSVDPALKTPADLVGRTVGLPAASGASYIGWQALLSASRIDPATVNTEVIGFQQLEAVRQGRVDAAVGYAANEPVQLRAQGVTPSVIEVADVFNFVSNGLVVSDALIVESPSVVQGLVTGLLAGMRDTLDDPDAAFETAATVVPEIDSPEVRDQQRQVLRASLRFWEGTPLGAIGAEQWRESQDFLVRIGLIQHAGPVEDLIDSRFVEASGAP
jgi:NitT/TauT family transport system substrate-binding protein